MKNKLIQHLNKGWEFKAPKKNKWYPANVPGQVHLDLFKNKMIEDPFKGSNEKMLQWIGLTDWEYRLYFKISKNLKNRDNIYICFDGIDTYATIFLNKKIILKTDNMFFPWKKEISNILKNSENELIIKFRSPINEVKSILSKNKYTLPAINDQADGTSPYTRKAPYHFGWDWGPCLVTSGIWKKVYVFGYNVWKIDSVSLYQKTVSKTFAKLRLDFIVQSNINSIGNLSISETEYGINETYIIKFKKGLNQFRQYIKIDNPKLWWPKGFGEQNLYNFKITLNTSKYSESVKKRIGIRNLTIKRKKDEDGRSFEIHINKTPIFSKGANWIPADSFTTRITKKKYRLLLESVISSNMNTLRVWGGGVYEPDYFYELCDELGILVWQDFMFACSLYPANKKFLNSVEKEVTFQINRLKHHPCIILWCGNNEVASAWLGWGWNEKFPQSVWSKDYKILFHQIIKKSCADLDPSRLYWPSSPGHSLKMPTSDQVLGSGDYHYWGVWHGGEDFSAFRKNIGRFMSEFGMQSFPEPKTVKTFAQGKDFHATSKVFLSHQRASLGNGNVTKYIDLYYSKPKDFKSYLIQSQIMQAKAIKNAVESHRSNMPFCMGSLFWQLNDCWPGASWSSIDYFGNWKALHYAAKRFFNPILLSFLDEKNTIKVYLTNDFPNRPEAKFSLYLMNFNGDRIEKFSEKIILPSSSSSKISEFQIDHLIKTLDKTSVFLEGNIKIKNKCITKNQYYFVKPKHLNLADPRLDLKFELKKNRYFLKIKAETFSHETHILCQNLHGYFSDNYFNINPGKSKLIEFFPIKKSKKKPNFYANSLFGLRAR